MKEFHEAINLEKFRARYRIREVGMMETYIINAVVKDINLKFNTSNDVFSPQDIDKGTLAMLSMVDFKTDDKVLDLGCGYGIVGILASKIIGADKVVMVDIKENAVELAGNNALLNDVGNIKIVKSDGFRDLDEKDFTLILSNPPYHVDFSVAKGFIEKGFNRLVMAGKMILVTKRKEWYQNKLNAIFGGVQIREVDGYYVFIAEKRDYSYAKIKKKCDKSNKDATIAARRVNHGKKRTVR